MVNDKWLIEMINDKVNSNKDLLLLKKGIKVILAGIQQSNFPITITNQQEVLQKYIELIYNGEPPQKLPIRPRDFIGPASVSLELENIRPYDEEINIVSITKNYTVTEKADGLRKLLYINNNGNLYLINMNMNRSLKTNIKL